ELGRLLLPSPYLSSSVVALVLAGQTARETGRAQAAQRYLPGLADGSLIGALALHGDMTTASGTVTGVARNVVDGAAAGLRLVGAGGGLVAVDGADASIDPLETLDQPRRQAVVRFDHAPALSAGPAALAIALQRVFLAAECAAAARRCLDVT